MSRCIATALLAIASCAVAAAPAAAEPARPAVDGRCPDAATVARAFATEGIVLPTGLRVRVLSDAAGSHLLISGAGAATAKRSLTSPDCAAVAEAFAIIVRSHVDAVSHRPRTSAPRQAPSLVRAAPASARADLARGGPELSLAASSGLGLALGPRSGARFAQLDLVLARGSAFARLGAVAGVSDPSGSGGPELERSQLAVRLELGRRLIDDAGWVRLGGGGGLALSSVRITEVEGAPRIRRIHPVITGALTGGLPVSDRLALQLELGATLFPVADLYTTSAMGEVGRSPRLDLWLGIGVDFSSPL